MLIKKTSEEGVDPDEFEILLDAKIIEAQQAAKPKTTKYGDLRKCPACGALVPAVSGACPECGYEFSGLAANTSAQTLAGKLERIFNGSGDSRSKNRRASQIIANFPIPNTKADLFDFISSLSTKIFDISLGKAYNAKLNECITKAKTMFPNDHTIDPVVRKAERKQHLIRLLMTFIILTITSFLTWSIVSIVHSATDPETHLTYCIKKVETQLEENNYEEVTKTFLRFKQPISSMDYKEREMFFDIAEKVVHECIIRSDTYMVERVAAKCGMPNKGNSNYIEINGFENMIIDYFLSRKEYEKAWEYVWGPAPYDMIKFVNIMCENGEKARAKELVNRNFDQLASCFGEQKTNTQQKLKEIFARK